MIRGIYTSAAGMLCETIRQDIIANNLANVDTAGFKQNEAIFKERPTMVIRKVNDGQLYPPRPFYRYPKIGKLGTGSVLDETFTNFAAGTFSYTGNDLDVSLANEKAFFLVESGDGIRYSRDGVFNINQNGFLTNMSGDFIMAEREPADGASEILVADGGEVVANLERIAITDGQTIKISEDGRVWVDGVPEYRLVQGQAADRKAFRKEGSNKFVRAYGDVVRAQGDFKAGYVEKPNFSIVEEMVKMIEVARAYEANSKVVQSHDALLDKAVNSIGVTRS